MSRAAEPRILPPSLVDEVERFATSQHDQAAQHSNVEVLDESGVFSLHRLAALIYAHGFEDGERAQAARDRGSRNRERDALRRAVEGSNA